jgi:RNA-directed DNA polymerase
MENIDKVISSWETYFSNRVRKRKDITGLYLKYARDLIERDMPPIFDFEHLSLLIGIKANELASLVADPDRHYRKFEMPKKRGGTRVIEVPTPALLEAQKWIKSSILDKIEVHGSAHGFVCNRSVVTNAKVHLGARCLLKVDIKDFFPSIRIRRGISVFMRLGFPPNVAYYLSSLCFKSGRLPQGAATSPSISNVVASRLDARLFGAAKMHGLNYSRYADDMVFSGSVMDTAFLSLVTEIVRAESFQLNEAKTQFVWEKSKKIITGVSISSGKLALPRKSVREIKQESHFLLKRGYWAHIEATGNRDPILIERLIGRVGFWLQIDPDNTTALRLRKALLNLVTEIGS